ncbi:hypothetical protein SAMN02745133_00007 [Desulforamulus putei DSM 12395]|uniref:Uncharacterized protein n=1 Tax=Desulforamulus putei DSM 12395 TaxID=1121429 RepID=A0A1M4S8F4_9FIRM|nr:hypothetical protein SAMN02745133_00007 [Desulforamulus putei DSM 12395]
MHVFVVNLFLFMVLGDIFQQEKTLETRFRVFSKSNLLDSVRGDHNLLVLENLKGKEENHFFFQLPEFFLFKG